MWEALDISVVASIPMQHVTRRWVRYCPDRYGHNFLLLILINFWIWRISFLQVFCSLTWSGSYSNLNLNVGEDIFKFLLAENR